jgi:hypothetical protein
MVHERFTDFLQINITKERCFRIVFEAVKASFLEKNVIFCGILNLLVIVIQNRNTVEIKLFFFKLFKCQISVASAKFFKFYFGFISFMLKLFKIKSI